MPSAMSRPSEPVEIASMSADCACFAPIFMIEPLPKARSIWLSAASSAFPFSILDIPLQEGFAPDRNFGLQVRPFYRLGRARVTDRMSKARVW
jgi:hypothetical protein